MKTMLKLAFGLILVGILYFGLFMVLGIQTYWPHQRLVIRVPYSFEDLPDSMIPMGETINHPKPQVEHGHPGIDFGYNNGLPHAVLASADGRVNSIKKGASEPGKWDVEIGHGLYLTRYKEMEDFNPALRRGSKIKQGDLVGHVGVYHEQADGNVHENLHWEFVSTSLLRDRYCPVGYFDPTSLASINTLWDRQPLNEMKQRFPDICSGDYRGHDETHGFATGSN